MLVMAVAGAAVLAFVSWASLREAQRMSKTFIADRAVPDRVRSTVSGVQDTNAGATSERSRSVAAAPPRIRALGDATLADADIDEALAAAAALWQVAVDTERAN